MKAEYGYPRTEIGKDYVRGLLGLGVCGAPFLWVRPAAFVVVILAIMSVIFTVLLLQTVYRHLSRIVVDDDGITVASLIRRHIAWNELRDMQLSYFTTWKSAKGFMELRLRGSGTTLRIGSTVQGFRDLVRVANAAAARNRLQFNTATIDNLRQMDLPDPRNYG